MDVARSMPGDVRPAATAPRRNVMADALYLGLAVGFFLLTWAFVKLCERV
jgi:hypothetical protein